jgi:pyruvate,water dikinase
MGGFWRRLARILPSVPRRQGRISVAEKFTSLRVIGAANDTFLANLARYQEKGEREAPPGLGAVAEAYEGLSAPVGTMVRSLLAMGGERYGELAQRYEALDRELAREVFGAESAGIGPLVVTPEDAEACRPEVVGPKTARLVQLARSGEHPVPPLFAVTVHGFRLFMEATGLKDLLEEAQAMTDLTDGPDLKTFSDMIAGAILGAPLPKILEEVLGKAVQELKGRMHQEVGLAVRSSAVVEDAASSFAGQFESVLNVPADGVGEAYKRVIASKYRPEVLTYALSRGFLDQDIAMPVLVMAMVRPRVSGVAYSRSPESPSRATVSAVPGLAQAIVDGRVTPDLYEVTRGEPPCVETASRGARPVKLLCAAGGGLEEVAEVAGEGERLALDETDAGRVAGLAWSLEQRFGEPQDVEWALDERDRLWVLQARPLNLPLSAAPGPGRNGIVVGYRLLLKGGQRASGGVAAGPVFRLANASEPGNVPEGSILVVPTTSPRLAGVIGTVAGIVAAAGSATGHMATVAREFGIPCLVGTEAAVAALSDGQWVTVDAEAGIVYEGEVPELLGERTRPAKPVRREPVRERLLQLVERVTPLTLTDPESPNFDPAHCRTLHDVARFVHQKAMAEMFAIEGLSAGERRACRRLVWHRPMEVRLLDLGGAVGPESGREVPLEDVTSVPLQALLEGMLDSRLRWAGPVGFDLKGFVSVVVRSAADDQRYGEPSYALCSADYLHFASRLAYHFALVDALCGESVNENYVRFRFHGGAAVAERREWRGQFLAAVLQYNRFLVTHVGDRVDAILPKRPLEELEDALVMLGRLMVASRHLDMVIESPAVALALARAFLAGDYGFELVRAQAGR